MEEEKEYTVIGEVKIGTDEYKDLIHGKMQAEQKAKEANYECWEQRRKASELNTKVEELEKTLKSYQEFFEQDEIVKEKYHNFILGKMVKELEGNE